MNKLTTLLYSNAVIPNFHTSENEAFYLFSNKAQINCM
jgi:hypothetical protein